jgi:hypothetical protein
MDSRQSNLLCKITQLHCRPEYIQTLAGAFEFGQKNNDYLADTIIEFADKA